MEQENVATTAVSIVVGKQQQQQVRIAVSAMIPRKRTSHGDAVQWTLQHYHFYEHSTHCNHLDALLTRLAPLQVVHLGSTERTENSSSKPLSTGAARKAQQVTALLEKIAEVVSSRTDLSAQDDENTDLVHVHSSLPKSDAELESILQHVLDEPSFLNFRGNAWETLVLKSMHLLVHAQGIHQNSPPNSTQLLQGVLDSHLVLDRTASQAIHLLPPPTQVGTPTSNNSSLYGILNRCHTSMGARELKAWLRQPLVNLQEIQKRQDAVAFLVQKGDLLRDQGLLGWPDVDALAVQLQGYKEGLAGATSKALASVYKLYLVAVQYLPVLVEALQDTVGDDDTSTPALLQSTKEGFTTALNELTMAQGLVDQVLDLDEAPRNFLVKATFEPEMQQVKQDLDSCDAELEECLKEMNANWEELTGTKQAVRLETLDSGEWQFRLPNTNDSKILTTHVKSVTIHRILKNGVYFSSKELRQLSTKKQDLLSEYDKHQRKIVEDCMTVASTYVPVLERTSELVAQLDVLCSLAHVAAYSPTGYCRPTLTDGDEDGLGIELKDARHPCVELHDSIEYIPNDISLVFGESSFLLVTGPNMGGKSTYIRALGAIVTLAQIGAYVPCTSAKINIVHHILARVGAGDMQDRGISTFMAEMLEASSILQTATKRSLIIIDELGRGTSTYDGFGLATAISEYIIRKVGCMTVFATHFHELTSLEDRCPQVKNCHVTANTDNGLTFMYQVRPGPCLESFGIQVAEMAQVPAVVVADAKRRAQHLENFNGKRKRTTEDEFRAKLKQIPLDKLSEEEQKQAIAQLLAETNI